MVAVEVTALAEEVTPEETEAEEETPTTIPTTLTTMEMRRTLRTTTMAPTSCLKRTRTICLTWQCNKCELTMVMFFVLQMHCNFGVDFAHLMLC